MKKILFLFVFSILTSYCYATKFIPVQTSTTTSTDNFVLKTGDTMTGHLNVPSLQVNTTSYFAGNVGIGAAAGAFPLEIISTSDQLNIKYDENRATKYTHGGIVSTFGAVNNGLTIQVNGGNAGYGGISLETDGTQRMFIDKTGNVGIGASNVKYNFEVRGQTRIVSDKIGDPKNDWGSSQPYLTTRLVGGTTVTAVLDIGVTNNQCWWIQSTLSDVVGFGNMLLLNPTGGNVGINTLNPSTALDVNGTATITQTNVTRVVNPPSTTQVLYSTNTISIGSYNTVVVSSGGAVTLSSNPQISTTTAIVGETILIKGSSDTNTITLIDGNGIKLSGDNPMTLELDDRICLEFSESGFWCENFRTND